MLLAEACCQEYVVPEKKQKKFSRFLNIEKIHPITEKEKKK